MDLCHFNNTKSWNFPGTLERSPSSVERAKRRECKQDIPAGHFFLPQEQNMEKN